MKKIGLAILFFLVLAPKGYCDGPNFSVYYKILNHSSKDFIILKAVQLHSNDSLLAEADTIQWDNRHAGGTYCYNNKCVTDANRFRKYHKLILFTDNDTLMTPVYKLPNWYSPALKIIVYDNKVEIEEYLWVNLIRTFKFSFCVAIFTVIVELFFGLLIVFKKFKKVFKYIIFANLISVPVLCILYSRYAYFFSWNFAVIIVLQLLTVYFEYVFYKRYLSKVLDRSILLLLSCFTNLLSFIPGQLFLQLYYNLG